MFDAYTYLYNGLLATDNIRAIGNLSYIFAAKNLKLNKKK